MLPFLKEKNIIYQKFCSFSIFNVRVNEEKHDNSDKFLKKTDADKTAAKIFFKRNLFK